MSKDIVWETRNKNNVEIIKRHGHRFKIGAEYGNWSSLEEFMEKSVCVDEFLFCYEEDDDRV